jgi:hypothetical protein
MKTNLALISTLVALIAPSASALEAVPRGNIQIQASYAEPEIGEDAQWSVDMPNTYIGLTAVEQLSSSSIVAHLQFGLDPLSQDEQATFEQQDAYLNWNQGVVSLWAGRLPSLETVYLEDLYSGAYSLPSKGLFIASEYPALENQAVRLDVLSGEYLVFSGQWLFDESESGLEWSTAAALNTPEGSISIVYRKTEDDSGVWGNQITWESRTSSVSAVWMFQDGVIAWNVEGRAKVQTFETFLSYGANKDKQRQYILGLQQPLSEAITNFTELSWQPDTELWQWSTGFNVSF